ncbi:MAG: lipoprotein-releasing ABC transporter permease subunit [Gammaproteobacteria bacterium]|nr:lipoprotein-releasing ABC transporter permease subunit [Gammaproteobacteria bacterium]
MFRPAALFIGLRYTRAKTRNNFISFISLVSMIGIALGVMVLVTVLSVMNGFDREIKKRVFTMVPPMTVSSASGYVENWAEVQKLLMSYPSITATAPFVTGEVLINFGGSVQPALITGLLPDESKKVSAVSEKVVSGKFTDLKPHEFGIILGQNLANRLGANLGDKVTLVTSKVVLSPMGVFPQSKRFTIVGLFHAGGGFGFDAGLGFIHLGDAQTLFGLGKNVSGLHVNMKDVYGAPRLAQLLRTELTPTANISTWTDQFGEFFHAVQLEKTIMFFILMLIVAVAAFNLVSTLVMVVNDKQSDIAILRTFGATPGMIMNIFIIQGGLVGVFGTLLGIIGGVLLASNVTDIVNWIEHVFRVQFLSSSVYFVNYLPSEVKIGDIVTISIASLVLSLVATLYPAFRAAKMNPVESLRYE